MGYLDNFTVIVSQGMLVSIREGVAVSHADQLLERVLTVGGRVTHTWEKQLLM